MIKNTPDVDAQDSNELSSHELSQQLMGIPAKKRLEAVLSRTDAEALVAALPAQDFFFFVKEIGPDDAGLLLALGQVDQLIHLFDIECWNKDQLQPAKALQWLERLASASEDNLLRWLYQADFELLVALFKKWIHVVSAPEDIDLLEASEQLPKHTLDDQFFWETQYLQFEDFLSRLLNLIFDVHPGFYRELMNHIIWLSEPEIEEQAYRFNRARLEDQAIPDFYESLELYRTINPREIDHNKEAVAPTSAGASPPTFAVVLLPKKDILHAALEKIQDVGEADGLRLELASLANKVIIADQLALDEADTLRQAMAKVSAYVNLGLDIMSRGALQSAVRIVREVFLEHLFRLAHTQVMRVKGRLQRLIQHGWLSQWPTGLKGLETGWMESAELLLQKTPRLVRPAPGAGSMRDEAFFRDRQDLTRAKHFVDVISAMGPLVGSLSVRPEALSMRLWQLGQIRRTEDLTFGVVIWTAAAYFQINGRWEVQPIKVNSWPGIFGLLGPELMERSIRLWVERIVHDEPQRELVTAYLNPLFQEYTQEMSSFSSESPPDPRLVKFFIFDDEGRQVLPENPFP
jgi:hypothetical protein